jgi:hypothetical protein
MNAQVNANLLGITGIAWRLVLDGALGETDARRALEESSRDKKPILTWLLEKRLVNSAQIAAANSIEFGMPLFDVGTLDLSQSAVKLVKEELIHKHQALPLVKRGNRLYVAIADPTHSHGLDELRFNANLTVEPVLVDAGQLVRADDHRTSAIPDATTLPLCVARRRPPARVHLMPHALVGNSHQRRQEFVGLLQRIGQNRRVLHVLVDHLVTQPANSHPDIARCDPAQSLGAIEVVERGAGRLPQRHQQRRQQFVAKSVLQPRESGDKSIHPFGKGRIAIQQTHPLGGEGNRK